MLPRITLARLAQAFLLGLPQQQALHQSAALEQPPPGAWPLLQRILVLLAASLGDVAGWTTLRPRNGRTQVSDGPYTESKEVVGGLFIIEADDHDEALRLASMHPAATLGEEGGWAVELIPIEFFMTR